MLFHELWNGQPETSPESRCLEWIRARSGPGAAVIWENIKASALYISIWSMGIMLMLNSAQLWETLQKADHGGATFTPLRKIKILCTKKVSTVDILQYVPLSTPSLSGKLLKWTLLCHLCDIVECWFIAWCQTQHTYNIFDSFHCSVHFCTHRYILFLFLDQRLQLFIVLHKADICTEAWYIPHPSPSPHREVRSLACLEAVSLREGRPPVSAQADGPTWGKDIEEACYLK